MKYKYKARCASTALKGEIIECTTDVMPEFTKGKLYILQEDASKAYSVIDDDTRDSNGFTYRVYAKIVKTKPSSSVKVGDTVIRTEIESSYDYCREHIIGETEIVSEIHDTSIELESGCIHIDEKDYLVLDLEEYLVGTKTEKRNLAFYKESGLPWTDKECENIVRYVGAEVQIKELQLGNILQSRKYMFDSGDGYPYMANWSKQEQHKNFTNCTKVSYESIFEIEPKQYVTYEQTNAEEQIMKETNIEIKVNGKEINLCGDTTEPKRPLTDLEIKPKYTVSRYTQDGGFSGSEAFSSEKKAIKFVKKELQKPSNLGCTYAIYKEIKVFTTNIPVVEVK